MYLSFDKWMVMTALTIVSILLGLIPYFIFRFTKTALNTKCTMYQTVLTILSCFSGGVLLATATLHVLPEVRESSTHVAVLWKTFDTDFPISEMLMLCGFSLIYFLEEIATFIMVDGHGHHNHHYGSKIARHNSLAHGISLSKNRSVSVWEVSHNKENSSRFSRSLTFPRNEDGKESDKPDEQNKKDDQRLDDNSTDITASLRAFLALIALSFHSIMEGVAIGIQEKADVWVMFSAVASHKFIISFCMGMELMTSAAGIRIYLGSIIFFAVVSPLGIIIGSIISSNTESNDTLPVVIVEGLVCGTLIYVVFFEILSRERSRKSHDMKHLRFIGFLQFISLIIGMIGMGTLSTLSRADNHLDASGDTQHHSIFMIKSNS